MDIDSTFFEGCKSCNSTSQRYRWPRSGQGDCKCSGEVQERNLWMKAANENKLNSKILQETEEIGLKKEKEKKLIDSGCSCLTKSNQKHEYKLIHEPKQEKAEPNIFENFSNLIPNSWKSKMERFYVSEEQKYHSISEKLLTENILELEKKVDFLLRTLKDCGLMHLNDNYFENVQTKGTATLGNAWHMFNFNRRLCVAEDGIEKLALILEELLKELCKNRGVFAFNESTSCSEPSVYDEMTVGQRVNFLKSRNNTLLSLIKTFLKSSSVEEICSKLSEEFESQPATSGGKNRLKDFNREEIIQRLENVKMEARELQPPKKTQSYSEDFNCKIGKREFGLKNSGNKLEAISEQAELAVGQEEESENIIDDYERKNEVRNFAQKFSQVSENEPDLRDVTSRLLAQEAILKSSLDKVHLELFSKLDSPDKNFPKATMNVFNSAQIPSKVENCTQEMDFDSLSDKSCTFCENKNIEKPVSNGGSSKYSKHEERKKLTKEERNSFGGNQNNLCKDSTSKKPDEQLNKKNKQVSSFVKKKSGLSSRGKSSTNEFSHKILEKDSCFLLGSTQKSSRTTCDSSFFSRRGSKHETPAREERPLTAPITHRKPSTPSSFKTSSPEKNTKKNSGINNNVKNKNKILLSKKSLVQTP